MIYKLSGALLDTNGLEEDNSACLLRALIPGNANLSEVQKGINKHFWRGKGSDFLRHSCTGRPIGPRYRIDQHGSPSDLTKVKDQPRYDLTSLLTL